MTLVSRFSFHTFLRLRFWPNCFAFWQWWIKLHVRTTRTVTHNALCAGAVLHHADVPGLPSGVRLQVPQGPDLLLHQQRSYIPLPLLGLLSKGLQEDWKNRVKIPDRSETIVVTCAQLSINEITGPKKVSATLSLSLSLSPSLYIYLFLFLFLSRSACLSVSYILLEVQIRPQNLTP